MYVTGYINITYKQEHGYIFQIIHIIANRHKNLGFFLRDKYILGRKIDDFLSKKYIGDGENIVYVDTQKMRNIINIKYSIKKGYEIDLKDEVIFVEGDIPKIEGCIACIHSRDMELTSKVRCLYYQEMLHPKIYCRDFIEKD